MTPAMAMIFTATLITITVLALVIGAVLLINDDGRGGY